jgi:hypothetical protein
MRVPLHTVRRAAAICLLATAASSCREQPPTRTTDRVVGWQRVGSWTGRGNMQSNSFTSDTGEFRVHWEARNETAPGKGTLKVQFRSGDSGRVIMEPVDHRGAGKGTEQIADNVRWYYLTVESADVDWSLVIEEPIIGHTVPRTDP